jgi:DNA repair protein RecO (recombination protein O)
MKVVSSECVILKHQDYRERDRLVTFLTRDKGRLTGVARGARRITGRGVGSYEPFNRGIIFYVESAGSELVSIRKCDPMPPFLYLDNDYRKFLFAGYMAELIMLCRIPEPEAERFFLLLADGLERLHREESARELPLLRLGFELDFLTRLGVQPEWSRCCVCERPLLEKRRGAPRPLLEGKHHFDVAAGGLRCPDCRGAGGALLEISPGSLAFLAAWRGVGGGGTVRPTRNALRELEAAVSRHLVHQLEREPRSLALLPPLDTLLRRSAG